MCGESLWRESVPQLTPNEVGVVKGRRRRRAETVTMTMKGGGIVRGASELVTSVVGDWTQFNGFLTTLKV